MRRVLKALKIVLEVIGAVITVITDLIEHSGKILIKAITFYGNLFLLFFFFDFLIRGGEVFSALCCLAGILTFFKVNEKIR